MPGPSGQWPPGLFWSHHVIPHTQPSRQHLFTLPTSRVTEVLGGLFSLSWGAQPRWGAEARRSPPARLSVTVVLDGQPKLAPMQGAAHAQAQLQVLITQTQQHLLPGKVGTERRVGGAGGTPKASRVAVGAGACRRVVCRQGLPLPVSLPTCHAVRAEHSGHLCSPAGAGAGAPGGEWITILTKRAL